jgi:hypothetical protein
VHPVAATGTRPGAVLPSGPPLTTQNVPSIARVAAGAFGFLIFSHAFDGPDLYGASSFFETIPSSSKLADGCEHFIAMGRSACST